MLFSAVSTEENEFEAFAIFDLYCIDPVYTESEEEYFRLADFIEENNDISPETRDKADEMLFEIDDRLWDLNQKFSEMITLTYGEGILPLDEDSGYLGFTVVQNTGLNIQASFDDQVAEVEVVATVFTDAQVNRGGDIYQSGLPDSNVRACADCHESEGPAPFLSSLQFCSDLSIAGAITDAQFTEDENYDLIGYCKGELKPFHTNNLTEEDVQAVIAYIRLIN